MFVTDCCIAHVKTWYWNLKTKYTVAIKLTLLSLKPQVNSKAASIFW